MIPYIQVHDFHLGPLTLHPFGVLVGGGILLGVVLAAWRARKAGLDVDELYTFIWWMLGGGFIIGHILDTILYHPAEIVRHPVILAMVWEGQSSFGGFAGALIGVLLWKRFEKVPPREGDIFASVRLRRRSSPPSILPYSDIVQSIFPIAWIFGRMGCAVVHDHPGARTAPGAFLSVAYGPGTGVDYGFYQLQHGIAPRYDLGLLEMIFAIILSIAFALTWRKRMRVGSYLVAAALTYAPVRFALDFLRAADLEGSDPRYGGLTPAQWGSIGYFLFGLMLWRYIRAQDSATPKAAMAEVNAVGAPTAD